MTDQEKAQRMLDKASRTMSRTEADLCERVVRGETHLLGEWTSKDDRRLWTWCETNFALYLK
jgi:hypothetical protein